MYNFKKRGLALSLALFVVLTSFNFVVSAAVPTGYYEIPFANSGFEANGGADPLPGWMDESVYDANATNPLDYNYARITNEMAHTGEDTNSTKSLLIYDMSANGTTEASTVQIPNISPLNSKFTAQLKYYIPEGDVGIDPDGTAQVAGAAYAQIRFYHSNGALRTTKSASVTMSTKGTWTTATIPEVTAPTDAANIKIVIFDETKSRLRKIYIDDVHLYKYGTATAPAATTKVFNKVPLLNSDFEKVVTDAVNEPVPEWQNASGTISSLCYFNLTDTKKFSGDKSLLIYDGDGVAAANPIMGSKLYSAAPGDTFKMDFKAFIPTTLDGINSSGEAMYAKFVFLNSAETPITTASYKKITETGRTFKDAWLMIGLDQPVAPALTAWVQVQFYQIGTQKGFAYIDDINLYSTGISKVKEPPFIPPFYETIENADFEDVVGEDGIVTGWSPLGTVDPETSYSISTDRSKSGASSLKLYDNSAAAGIELSTPLIKARPSTKYLVTYSVYNERDSVSLMGSRSQFNLYEYDASGAQIKVTSKFSGPSSGAVPALENVWEDLSIEVEVLPETRYIRLAPGVSPAWKAFASFYDKITLGYAADYKYVSNVTFSNVDETPFTEFVADKEVKASINVFNKTGDSFPIFFAAAVYDDVSNQLVSVGNSNNSLALTTDSTLNATFTVPDSLAGKTIKVFVWSGVGFMKPYYKQETIVIE